MDNLDKKTEIRPWGSFEQFTQNKESTVKIITIKAGEEFSLQTHTNREEFWRILRGSATVTVGDVVNEATVGDEFFVPINTPHRIAAGEETVEVLEISFGEFDEDDIVRLEDRYGRV